ncbi:type 4a pilus biogenesis protein PilO [Deinococcus cellulosilyticus]|uniref:Pilus assembly protein PilO n=1 Tax=Deinococcus cellulosilyticus (strain DSM 18568 / NBRC 106333 / KACC 11606 / 5516J-15) TaxID=1223518 RepID=A0A511N8D4_DEIC1|nr:type 4a pilus biogenesis protein PilO [Deinococcus cellulosilyticus]GEM48777.1 hypothetical protein DC3_44120 [Deinococcus cellulosilyticus NBRC 106333 = KACC 11606]
MKLKQRDIALISFAATLLVILLWYFMMYQPKGDEIASKQLEKDSLQTQLDRARAAAARLPQLRLEVAQLEEEKQAFLQQLPETLQFGNFLQDLRQIVVDSGSTLTRISPVQGTQGNLPNGVVPMNVTMTLDTTFPGLLSVVSAIQSLQRFSTINSINLSVDQPSTTTNSNPSIDATLVITVYTFDVNKALQQNTPPPADGNAAPQGGNAS